MKFRVMLTNEDGDVLRTETVGLEFDAEDEEQWNLSKSMACSAFMQELIDTMEREQKRSDADGS